MKELGIGVIGVGLWGENHLKVYKDNPNCRVIGISDMNERRAEEIAKKYNVKIWSKDYRALLDNKDIDIVSIVVPDFEHYKPVCQAAEAGKNILVEKPLATDLEEAQKMVQVCKKNRVKIMVDFSNRWNPAFVNVKNAIVEGELGRLLHCSMILNDTIFVPTVMLKWAELTKVVHFIGSHAIDLLCWLTSTLFNKRNRYSPAEEIIVFKSPSSTITYLYS